MNLTINENLMKHTQDANLCIFIANLASWMRTNATKLHLPLTERNFREGRYWSYNSIKGLVKFFGFWSTQNIKTIIKKGIEEDLILTNTFNHKKFDNTLWYSLTDKGLEYYPYTRDLTLDTLVSSNKRLVSSNHTIPEDTTTCSNNTITTISDSPKSPTTILYEILDAYHEVLPECPKVKVVDSKLKSQLNQMQKNWPKYQKDGKKFSIESFKDYLNYIKQHYAWFIQPYTTSNGNVKRNNLRVFTREINITKIVNGEFNAS